MAKRFLLILGLGLLFLTAMIWTDRFFFKQNKSFRIQMILSTLPARPEWETPPLSLEEKEEFLDIVSQKFRYLDRGGQSAAFISDDEAYVLKFYRFPSHLRPLGWVKHPLSYRFSKKREEIKKHNFEKLDITFQSFLLAYRELKEESGLVYIHLNPTADLQAHVTLIDPLNNQYEVNLDRVAFVLQKKATRIFPTLHRFIVRGEQDRAKAHLNSLVQLITKRCAQGIIDNDAILDQNYGFADSQAIHVDIGRLTRDPTVAESEKTATHAHHIFWRLRAWLQEESPELATYFEERLEETLSMRS